MHKVQPPLASSAVRPETVCERVTFNTARVLSGLAEQYGTEAVAAVATAIANLNLAADVLDYQFALQQTDGRAHMAHALQLVPNALTGAIQQLPVEAAQTEGAQIIPFPGSEQPFVEDASISL